MRMNSRIDTPVRIMQENDIEEVTEFKCLGSKMSDSIMWIFEPEIQKLAKHFHLLTTSGNSEA